MTKNFLNLFKESNKKLASEINQLLKEKREEMIHEVYVMLIKEARLPDNENLMGLIVDLVPKIQIEKSEMHKAIKNFMLFQRP